MTIRSGESDSARPPSPDLPDISSLAMKDLRQQVGEVSNPTELENWSAALRQDRRLGARQLGERVLRSLERQRQESRRLEKLFVHREGLFRSGYHSVAGVDEVGVGPLAGPVVAAAVVLPAQVELPGLNDSKKLSAASRERLDIAIREQALGFALGEVSSEEIDRLNILNASLEAMRRAVVALAGQLPLDHLLVDARRIPGVSIHQTALVHGDAIDASIAAASILAKVYRDGLMRRLAREYPGYGLERHKGYGTAEHMKALEDLGASPVHRRSFAPVAAVARPSV